MHTYFDDLIKIIGFGNALTIVFFIVASIIAIYFYFKNFYRLVYSTENISKKINQKKPWKTENLFCQTRFLFYNNGSKTLSDDEVKKLCISSEGEILAFKILEGGNYVSTFFLEGKIKIGIDYLDSDEYFLIEVDHKGNIKVDGRIKESGKILHSETRSWGVFYGLILAIFLPLFYVTISEQSYQYSIYLQTTLNFLLLFGTIRIVKFFYSLFFIPTKLTSEFLNKNENTEEFRSKY